MEENGGNVESGRCGDVKRSGKDKVEIGGTDGNRFKAENDLRFVYVIDWACIFFPTSFWVHLSAVNKAKGIWGQSQLMHQQSAYIILSPDLLALISSDKIMDKKTILFCRRIPIKTL